MWLLDKLRDVAVKNILDLGCGEGVLTRELARRGALVTAVDLDEDALVRSAKLCMVEELPVCHFIRDSADLDGFADNSSDAVLCSMMLMDCADPAGTVREAARVLKPGGILHVTLPCDCRGSESYLQMVLQAGLTVVKRETTNCRQYFALRK